MSPADEGCSSFRMPLTIAKRRLFQASAVCGALLFGGILAEVGVRLSGVNADFRGLPTSELRPRAGGPYELSPCGHVPFATIRMRYPSNPRGYFDKLNGIDHVINSVGWREREVPIRKRPGTFRILGLGD